MQPHKATATRFVELLTGRSDTPVNLRLFSDRERGAGGLNLFGPIDDLWPQIEGAAERHEGVFIIVNEGGNTDAEIAQVRALFIDGDGIPLPEEWEWHKPPSFVVSRGPLHWHAYWLVTDCPPEAFGAAQKRLAARYGSDPVVFNLSRVMRLPGTLHVKGAPVPVRLQEGKTGGCYPLSVLLADLPAIGNTEARQIEVDFEWDTASALNRAETYLASLPETWPGNHTGYAVAARLTDLGISPETAAEMMDARWNPKGAEEWRQEIDAVVAHAGEYRQNAPGVDTVAPVAQVWSADLLGKLAAEPAKRPEQPPDFHIYAIDEIEEFPDPEFLVDGVLVEGENTILGGQMKSAKTFTAIDYAMSIATGLPVFGTQAVMKTGSVVYMAGEGRASFKARLLAWRIARGVTEAPPFFLVDRVPMASAGADDLSRRMDAILARTGQPILTVVDTMSRATGDMKEDNLAGSLYLAMAETIHRRFGGTFLSLAHFGKAADLGVRGHTSAAAGVDANWKIERKDQHGRDLFKLDLDNGRNTGHLGPYFLALKHISTGVKLDNGYVLEQVPRHLFDGVKVDDPFEGIKIGALLREHNAIGDQGVPTSRLATWISPPREGQTPEDYAEAIKKTVRSLDGKARSSLQGYVSQSSPIRLWALPS